MKRTIGRRTKKKEIEQEGKEAKEAKEIQISAVEEFKTPETHTANIIDMFKEWNYSIVHVVVAEHEGMATPIFIKVINCFGYAFYIELNAKKYIPYNVKEEKMHSSESARSYIMEKESIITMMECIGCDVHGIIYECSNGIAYYSCSEKSSVPKERIFLKDPKRLFVHMKEDNQVIGIYIGIVEKNETMKEEYPDIPEKFQTAIAFPVILIDEIIENGHKIVDSTVMCTIQKLRNNKIKSEEQKILKLDGHIEDFKKNLKEFHQLRYNVTKKLEETIQKLQEYTEDYMKSIEKGETLTEEQTKKYEKLVYNLKRRHELIIDLIKFYTVVGCFSNMISWMNQILREINENFKESDFARIEKILGETRST